MRLPHITLLESILDTKLRLEFSDHSETDCFYPVFLKNLSFLFFPCSCVLRPHMSCRRPLPLDLRHRLRTPLHTTSKFPSDSNLPSRLIWPLGDPLNLLSQTLSCNIHESFTRDQLTYIRSKISRQRVQRGNSRGVLRHRTDFAVS